MLLPANWGKGDGFVFASLALRDHRPRAFENKGLRRIFLSAWKEVG
jgi:hypothetical protein